MKDKRVSLTEAAKLVPSGCTLAIGGGINRRNPSALVRELVRQSVKDLTILAWNVGFDLDILVGVGAVKRYEGPYAGMGPLGFANNFRRAVEQGTVSVGDYSETAALARLRAAGLGLPFMPTKVLLGTDMATYAPDVKAITCPFTGQKLHAVAAAKPDVAILYAYAADCHGNVQWPVVRNIDVDLPMAKAAERVIVVAEKIIPHEQVERTPAYTYVPHYWVEAVVEAPFGAHPGSSDGLYEADEEHLKMYCEMSRQPESFQQYLQRYVYEPKDHWDYIGRVGGVQKMYQLRVG